YSLDASMPLAKVSGGSATVARADRWPILQRQALYHLTLTTVGMREPHWHPETAEMGYVHQGKGRMSILSPSGSIDTYEMEAGDLYFIPHAYPHHIENLGADDLKILIFFDRPMPGDVGFTGSLKAQGEEVLEAFLDFPKGLPTYYEDLLIVDKYVP
ncbi:MAG: cupin domain-containing protein, partial [Chlamydiia bacterium]|nr:cupin domain-containing protein [Chlamydiia bacterium]